MTIRTYCFLYRLMSTLLLKKVKNQTFDRLCDRIDRVFIIAHQESTELLEATLNQEGFACKRLRQVDQPEYRNYAAIHRCMLNHQRAWRLASQRMEPSLIVEADFVPVIGMGQLPVPFNLQQANVGIAWLYTCAPQLYSVTAEGFGEGYSAATVAYIVTPNAARQLCELVDQMSAAHGTGYHNFDSEIDEFLRKRGFKNFIPFRNYGEHGGRSNPEHRHNGMTGIHHADLLYGKLAFMPPYLVGQKNARLKLWQMRSHARLKGIARLVMQKYLRVPIVRNSSFPLRLVRFAIGRHFSTRW
jgi:hypothetical protein